MSSDGSDSSDDPIITGDFGIHGIFPRRSIKVNGKSAPTPAVAIPIDRMCGADDDVHLQSRRINEVHISINEDKISREMGSEKGPITQEIEDALEFAEDDEITIIFTTYTETITLEFEGEEHEEVPIRISPAEAECLVETISEHTDILPVPMFRHIAYSVDEENGRDDAFYNEYLKSVVTFLNHVDAYAQETTVMGVLSARLPWTCLKRLFEIYNAFGVKAFNFNLDRLKLTADSQVDKVDKMMEFVAEIGWEEDCLFYLMNPERGDLDSEIEALPSADLAGLGFGFDIIGTRRVRRRMDYDKLEPDPNSFYIFDRDQYVYRRTQLRNLEQDFPNGPDGSAFEVEEVVQQCRENPDRKYDIQPLLNFEQISLAAMDFRKQESGEPAYWFLREKDGFTDGIADSMHEVRISFNEAIADREQSDLADF